MACPEQTRDQERAIEALSIKHAGYPVIVQSWPAFVADTELADLDPDYADHLHADVAGRGYRVRPDGDVVTESGLRIRLARLEQDGREIVRTAT